MKWITGSPNTYAGKTEVRSEEMEVHHLRFSHVTEQGKAVFDLADESHGTRNLFFLAGPVLDILGKGLTLVIGELDTSLHTLLVRELVDSNDRFAISQTNYLLQRIEFCRGIVLLTSNSRDRFDSAFTRRLDKIIDFPLPSSQERRALWQRRKRRPPPPPTRRARNPGAAGWQGTGELDDHNGGIIVISDDAMTVP